MKTTEVKNDEELQAALSGEPVNIVVPEGCTVGDIVVEEDNEMGDIYVRGESGNISVRGKSGDISVRGESGAISVGGESGNISVRGKSGGISVSGIATDVHAYPGAVVHEVEIDAPTRDEIAFLKSLPLDRLDMRAWHRGDWQADIGKEPDECGTAHCVAGHCQARHGDTDISAMDSMIKHYPNLTWLCYLTGGELAKRTIERLISEAS